MSWQLIETAPKDGTAVILWAPNFDSAYRGCHIAKYCDYGDSRSHWAPFVPCDWTHWMPLPDRPQEVKIGEALGLSENVLVIPKA